MVAGIAGAAAAASQAAAQAARQAASKLATTAAAQSLIKKAATKGLTPPKDTFVKGSPDPAALKNAFPGIKDVFAKATARGSAMPGAFSYDSSTITASHKYKGTDRNVGFAAVKDVLDGMHQQKFDYLNANNLSGLQAGTGSKHINCGVWANELQDGNGKVNSKNVSFLQDNANALLKNAGSQVTITSIAPMHVSRTWGANMGLGHEWVKMDVTYNDAKGRPHHMNVVTETNYGVGTGAYHTILK